MLLIIAVIVLVVLFYSAIEFGKITAEINYEPNINCFILLLVIIISLTFMFGYTLSSFKKIASYKDEINKLNQTPEFYYLPAEILFQENDHVCFCTDNGNYIVEKNGLDSNTEYLLYMASNGTKDVTNDEVCVIWEVK